VPHVPRESRRRLGSIIRTLRRASDFTQTQLGDLCGCGVRRMGRIELGDAIVRPDELSRLKLALPALTSPLTSPKRVPTGMVVDGRWQPRVPVGPEEGQA
jgi:transcriptional regulator with XRE-family HTH domain